MGLLLEHDLHVLVTDRIHVVQFNSIPRTFALKLHKKLRNLDNYLCFTQVIPDNKLHQHIFASFIPRYKLEKGKINVLFSAIGDDEWLADEMIEWVKERYSWLSLKVTKYDVESRFSIFDKNTSPENEFLVPKMSHLLKEEWEIQVEIALHKLEDVAPHALTELKSAIDKLSMSKLSPADCAQIAINLRRFLEKIANTLIPPKSNKDKERYKDRLAWYIREKLSRTKYYENHVEAELNDLVNRVEKLYIMSNKGVHEDYSPQAFSIVILRVIILTRELLLPIKSVKPSVQFEPGLFSIDED